MIDIRIQPYYEYEKDDNMISLLRFLNEKILWEYSQHEAENPQLLLSQVSSNPELVLLYVRSKVLLMINMET